MTERKRPGVADEVRDYIAASRLAADSGKILIAGAGNTVTPPLNSYFAGPPWVIAVGGFKDATHRGGYVKRPRAASNPRDLERTVDQSQVQREHPFRLRRFHRARLGSTRELRPAWYLVARAAPICLRLPRRAPASIASR